MKKLIFLVFTLAIPVSIFLFLKFFGTNTFVVPVLFEDGIAGCENPVKPHVVPEEFFRAEGLTEPNALSDKFKVIYVLEAAEMRANDPLIVQLVRIQDAFYELSSPYFILYVPADFADEIKLSDLLVQSGMKAGNFSIVALGEDQMNDFLRCGVGLIDDDTSDTDRFVLIDTEGQIRGMYKSMDMEQTDRLILELKILKQKA